MFIAHIALQGCLRSGPISYGITADTGGHIRYLLELVAESAKSETVERIDILTRGFDDGDLGDDYLQPNDIIDAKCRITRLLTENRSYLSKERLAEQADALFGAALAWYDGLDRKPDILHAHYADAGLLASRMKQARGVPYIFTGHSLGRVKAVVSGIDDDAMRQRIAIEEQAIADADLIIASSRDEAEKQYAEYRSYAPGKISVIPPGGDFARFANARSTPTIRKMLGRFLTDTNKPAILAIARPVTKKNLAALLHAYGQSEELQQSANLILIAGTRGRLSALEGECRDNMRELIELIDHYDLYGRVAYPKSHDEADIPGIYGYARETGGIFVNPALNEPFGLTLLEASAAGLPLVATDSGGPNDIIEACGNGLLVSPTDQEAIADGCRQLLGIPDFWRKCSDNGRQAVFRFDWAAHCRYYHMLAGRLVNQPIKVKARAPQILLASDIDNTLVGNEAALTGFRSWQERVSDILFGIATGRSFHSAMSILAQSGAPEPTFVIAAVGSEIYYRDANGVTFRPDLAWENLIGRNWQRQHIAELIATETDLRPQHDLEQRAFKLSYFTDADRDLVADLRTLLSSRGLNATVIRSHSTYLDILPARASKGAAVDHVRRHFGLPARAVIAAGDSGNDIEMLRTAAKPIIVANYSDGLAQRRDLRHAYVAKGSFAAGIVEGARHYLGRHK